MDESQIEASLLQYKEQLSQLNEAWHVSDASTRAELDSLIEEMKQLITLTEESLLSLKKSNLLSMIDGKAPAKIPVIAPPTQTPPPQRSAAIDDEYAAFQALLAEDEPQAGTSHNSHHSDNDNDNDVEDDSYVDDLPLELRALEGTQCRVPYEHHWGQQQLHNAMVMCAEPLSENQQPKVRVMFSNPTHRSMLPCQYYLDGKCNYGVQQCRFSHGYVVPVKDLQEYHKPNFSLIKVGSSCMACDVDRLWHAAVIVDVLEDHEVKVKWDRKDEMDTLPMEKLWPMDCNEFDDSESSEDDEVEGQGSGVQGEALNSEVDDLPRFLWKPPDIKQPMAEWEKHTKGIGSKLMKGWGYVMGDGLGRLKEGRAEPVPIQMIPQGKSLDRIMELKEIAGDRDLYDAMKAQKRKQKQIDDQAAGRAKVKKNVFDFLNHKLSEKPKGKSHAQSNTHKSKNPATHITERELDSRSDKHISLQICQTDDEIRVTERKLCGLQSSLKRNMGVNQSVVNQLRQKVKEMEIYLKKLKTSQNSLENNRTKRTNHKKLSIF